MKIAVRNSRTFPHPPLKFSIKSYFPENKFNYFSFQLKIVLKKFRKKDNHKTLNKIGDFIKISEKSLKKPLHKITK